MPVTLTDPTRAAHALICHGALRHNVQRLRTLAPKANIMAVIKANAYGHGMLDVAKTLALAGVDAFAVARTDGAIELRQAGITHRIAVLQGFFNEDELKAHAALGLEPVIHSAWQVDLLERIHPPVPIRIWLKVDTGMHRLGLLPEEFEGILQRLKACRSIEQPIPLMSHLANADALEDSFTQSQLSLFEDIHLTHPEEASVANSAGILGWDQAVREWIRPGISIYGVSPFPKRSAIDEGLQPVMTLRTRLISIKEVKAGTPVGYGGDWICPQPTRLGVAAIGYGDGYPRLARAGTPVLINHQKAALIGRVSMDMITLDLTPLKDSKVGDLVTLWGDGLPVETIADAAGTIPYDLLCGVTRRVKFIDT